MLSEAVCQTCEHYKGPSECDEGCWLCEFVTIHPNRLIPTWCRYHLEQLLIAEESDIVEEMLWKV